MRFEISERIKAHVDRDDLLDELEVQFKKIAQSVEVGAKSLYVESVEASFGSINRKDFADITIRKKKTGWLCVAEVTYKPSVAFWILVILLLFTTIFWLLPIIFYLVQKNTVRDAIEKAFRRVRDEFEE